eukprot:TRINITY_DN89967_c0_g1_i1.p1 TRINITY_DN89967_c0_g1~~TRINITY_DN89967_c0_g1_i1.p1  ORF type:complete len:778 (-),score=162.98 TRINITY_DN89967_c0_g1_i1:527-2818(-)
MARPSNSILDAFRKPDFNVAAFVRDATGQGQDRTLRLSQQLQDCASSLEEDLRREIAACHEELLQCAGSVSELDGQLGEAGGIVESLKASVARVRGDVLGPFREVKRKVELLERMQAVNVLIRKLLRFLFDARKLRTQMDGTTKDFSKAAHTLHELELVLQESNLEKVEVLRAEVLWIRETGARIRRQSEDDLRTGVRQGNQIGLSVALQVFFSLECLWPQLKKLLAELLDEVKQAPLPAGASFSQSLEVNLQVLVAQTQRVHALDELVKSKVDPLTHKSFTSVLEAENITSLTAFFWSEAVALFKTKIGKVCQDRAFKKTLVTDCPKVMQSLVAATERLMLRGKGQVIKGQQREELYRSADEIRNEFLGESIRRITDPVEMMLPERLLSSLTATGERSTLGGDSTSSVSDELPTMHDVRRYVQLLMAEVERAQACPDLLLKEVVRAVRSGLLFFATRLEQVVDSSCVELNCFEPARSDGTLRLRAPLPMPSAGHARNARLYGIAHHTLGALKDLIPAKFQSMVVTEQVQTTLKQTQAAVITPMISSLQRALLGSYARLEACSGSAASPDGSPDLLAAAQALTHINKYFFSLFGAGQLQGQIKDLSSFSVRCFLSQVCLVKPCELPQRTSLAKDMQVVESLLSSLDSDFQSRIRYEAGVFKEFRKLLCAQQVESLDFDELTNVLPLHLLLTYLVHQLSQDIPRLPEFMGVTDQQYLEETLLPLWDDDPKQVQSFKASVANLADKHSLDPTESTFTAFIISQTG